MPPRTLNPQSVWDIEPLLEAFSAAGVKSIHADRLWSHIQRHPNIQSFDEVPELPKAALSLLREKFTLSTTRVEDIHRSADGETTKMIIRLQDGLKIEAVIMMYDTRGRYSTKVAEQEEDESDSASTIAKPSSQGHKRATLCVSSQVGCQMGCTFCSTGTMGLKGNLTSGEILEQLVFANSVGLNGKEGMKVKNIVFMGMGEPLMNYEAVKSSVSMMIHPSHFGLGRQQVTISTVGIIPRIKALHNDLPGVSLALSLHAPTQELRSSIVPSAKAYKLDKLMDAISDYEAKSGLKVFYEYVMLAGVNDSEEVARQLGTLLSGRKGVLNLIPWNPTYVTITDIDFRAPGQDSVLNFQRIIRSEFGVSCTVRQEKGQDVEAACGMLVIKKQQEMDW